MTWVDACARAIRVARSRAKLAAMAAAAGVTLAAPEASAQAGPPTVGYAPVDGLEIYYEIHGSGRPLVLLHGGVGTIDIFGPNLAALSASRQVIAAELQGHGHTADIDRPLRYELMADDVVGLLDHLGIERADIMGYSLGGGVALQVAIRHPEHVRKLVVVSTTFKRDGWYPEIRASMEAIGPEVAEGMKNSPLYAAYSAVAPRPEDWPRLFEKLGDLLKRDYDWSGEVSAIDAPTLVVAADADGFPPAHAVALFELLGGGQRDAGWDGSGRPPGQLAILPGTTHYDIAGSPALAAAATPFLDAPPP